MNEINSTGFEKSQIKILSLLMRLRQICCHPSLFIKDYKEGSSKLEQCIEIVKDATEAGHKILLFSGFTSMFDIITKELEKRELGTKATRADIIDKLYDRKYINGTQQIEVNQLGENMIDTLSTYCNDITS